MMNKFLITFGALIVSSILYNRLWKYRLPRDIFNDSSYLIIIVYCISFFTMVFLFIFYICKTINKRTEFKNKIFLKITNIISRPLLFWNDSLKAFDIAIKNSIPLYDENMSYIDIFLFKLAKLFCKYYRRVLPLLFGITILIQSLVCLAFIYDVFVLNSFKYFYALLWTIILPLIISYIIYSIRVFVETNLDSLNTALIIRVIPSALLLNTTTLEDFTLIDVYKWQIILQEAKQNEFICSNTLSEELLNQENLNISTTLAFCVDSLNTFYSISSFLNLYDTLVKKIMYPYNIIKYFSYSISWGFILYKIIF